MGHNSMTFLSSIDVNLVDNATVYSGVQLNMNDLQKSPLQLFKKVHTLHIDQFNTWEIIGADAEKLGKSEDLLLALMHESNDGLWYWDIESGEAYFSPRWKQIMGYGADELEDVLSIWPTLIHPEDKPIVMERLQKYKAGLGNSSEIQVRMRHRDGHEIIVLSRTFPVKLDQNGKVIRIAAVNVDVTEYNRAKVFREKNSRILEMVAVGHPASEVYDEIALMYEDRNPGMRCSMLELHGAKLLHGGAPSLPEEYCEALNGMEYGPDVGSCGTSTYTGKSVLVDNIETDPKWEKIRHLALPHGMRCCWSEPIKNSSGTVLGAFGMYYDYSAMPNEEQLNDLESAARLAGIVMERDQAQNRIHQLAYTDELTGLPSRACFYQNLEKFIETSKQHDQRFSLLYIDLDDFKGVNDSLGHDVGDSLLKEVATRLANIDCKTGFIARLSGDEFCILIEDQHGEVADIAQRCLDVVSQPIELLSRKLTPACSIGIAHYPDDAKDASTLIKAADTSLYAAKDKGKNQYTFYKPELTQQAEYRFQVEQYLKEAVENQQLSLVYQPQLNIQTDGIVGVEALCRWNHPVLGQVPPADFIQTAERIGVIKPLTEWVLYTACHQAVAWKKAGLPNLRMAVNISPGHFLDQDFVPLIRRVISETGMEPGELELEVTESVVQTDLRNLSMLQDLKDIGILLAIDDFGTGYSSFASLKHFSVDCLKIDKYFIDDMLADEKTRLLIASMIDMGHSLGHGIIAEGVEMSEQLNMLRELGCDSMQGFVFSEAICASEVTNLFGNKQPAIS